MRTYGWCPDVPDYRDYTYLVKRRIKALPATVDLRKHTQSTANSISVSSLLRVMGGTDRSDSIRSRIKAEVRGAETPYLYERVPRTAEGLCGVLSEGLPFVLGLSAYSAFEDDRMAKTGLLHLPKPTELLLGGMVALGMGYVMRSRRFIVRSPWGSEWGKNGDFTAPFEYLLNPHLAGDFWVVRRAV
jgi:hypothetical protein